MKGPIDNTSSTQGTSTSMHIACNKSTDLMASKNILKPDRSLTQQNTINTCTRPQVVTIKLTQLETFETIDKSPNPSVSNIKETPKVARLGYTNCTKGVKRPITHQ
jgi:hypothetical protein